MLKYILLILPILTNAQIGINTNDPKATLDIMADNSSLTPNGLLSPKVTGSELMNKIAYSEEQIGVMIYVTDVSGIDLSLNTYKFVTKPGYYYYSINGVWEPFESRTATIFFEGESDVNQIINSNNYTKINLNSTGTHYSNWIDNTFTIPISGKYLITARVNLTDNSIPRDLYIVCGDSAGNFLYGNHLRNGEGKFVIPYTRLDNFLEGDKISLYLFSKDLDLTIERASLDIILMSIH